LLSNISQISNENLEAVKSLGTSSFGSSQVAKIVESQSFVFDQIYEITKLMVYLI